MKLNIYVSKHWNIGRQVFSVLMISINKPVESCQKNLLYYVGTLVGMLGQGNVRCFSLVHLQSLRPASQGLHNEFQITGANHYLMTLIQSKTVIFSFFLKVFGKLTGENDVSINLTDAVAHSNGL